MTSTGPVIGADDISRIPEKWHLYQAALVSLILLVAATLLYPDTYLTLGISAGPFRISGLAILYFLAAPAVIWFISAEIGWLKASVVDVFLLLTMAYVGLRGAQAAQNGNDLGLVAAYVSYALLLYYGTAVVGQGKSALKLFFLCLAGVALVVALLALLEFALGWNFPYEDYIKESTQPFHGSGYHRSGSTLAHPVALGAFMVQVAPFLIFLFVKARSAAVRVAWGVAIIVLALALLVTYSKGAWGAAAALIIAGGIWLAWKRPAGTRVLIALSVIVGLTLGLFTLAFYDTVHAGTLSKARTSESINPRTYMWSKVPSTFLANPIVGAGLWQGNAEVFRVNPAPEATNRPESIDNVYLTTLVEQGLIGVALVGITLLFMGREALRVLRESGEKGDMALAIAASILLILINGLTFNSLMIWPNMVIFWLAVGMMRSLVELRKSQAGRGFVVESASP